VLALARVRQEFWGAPGDQRLSGTLHQAVRPRARPHLRTVTLRGAGVCDAFLEHLARDRSRAINSTSAPETAPGNPERVRVSDPRQFKFVPTRHTSKRHVQRPFLPSANLLLMGWRA
jgi:hypothetical protein